MKAIPYLLAAILFLLFTACGGSKTPKKNPVTDSTKVDTSSQKKPAPQVDAQLDDLARLLAGMAPNQYYKNIAENT